MHYALEVPSRRRRHRAKGQGLEPSTQTSLESVIGGSRDLPGEDLLRNDTEMPAPEADSPASSKQDTKAKSGEQVEGATPAQAEAADEDSDDSDPHPVPRKALIAERKKRQEYERKLAELEGKLSVYTQQSPRPPAPEQSRQTDPADEFYAGPVDFIAKREQQILQAVEQRFLAASIDQVRAQYQDYGEAEQAFVEAAQANPALTAQLKKSANPALFAYQNGKAFIELKGIGSLDELRERVRQEEREKLEAEYKKQNVLTAAAQASTSSVGARGANANTSPVFSGPTPLNQIFGKRS